MWNFLYLFQTKIYLRAGFNDTSQTYQKLLLWLFIWVELGLVEYSFPIAHCSSNNSVRFKDSAFCCHLLTNLLTFNELKNEKCACNELRRERIILLHKQMIPHLPKILYQMWLLLAGRRMGWIYLGSLMNNFQKSVCSCVKARFNVFD